MKATTVRPLQRERPRFLLRIEMKREGALARVQRGRRLVLLSVAVVFNSVWAAGMVLVSLPLALGGVMAACLARRRGVTREAAVGVIWSWDTASTRQFSSWTAPCPAPSGAPPNAASLHRRRARSGGYDRAGHTRLTREPAPARDRYSHHHAFGAIALANAGGIVAGTLGALSCLPCSAAAAYPAR